MQTFDSSIYFTTGEVGEVLDTIPSIINTDRKRKIVKAFYILKAKHGNSAKISNKDVCDYLHCEW